MRNSKLWYAEYRTKCSLLLGSLKVKSLKGISFEERKSSLSVIKLNGIFKIICPNTSLQKSGATEGKWLIHSYSNKLPQTGFFFFFCDKCAQTEMHNYVNKVGEWRNERGLPRTCTTSHIVKWLHGEGG